MGESIVEGTITKWLKKPGDRVEKDEPLFEISTDKVDAEIPSPAAGILSEIKVPEGATVGINTVVAVIGGAAPVSAEPTAPTLAPETSPAPATAGTDVVMPQMGESIVEGTITKWLKKVGDQVEKDEPLFEISTDKVDAEIPAPVAGPLTQIKVPEGATVEINTVVAVIGGSIPSAPTAIPTATQASAPAPKAQQAAPLASGPPHRQREQPRPHPDPRHRRQRPHHKGRHPPPPQQVRPRWRTAELNRSLRRTAATHR
jgi:2-oxoglutarate dehydrogenase E2 component (dihydrolipoamide succinyltransferase)